MAMPAATEATLAPRRSLRAGRLGVWAGRLARVGESRPAVIGLAIILVWVLAALLAPLIAPYPPNASNMAALANPTPSRAHWLGTDHLGRDLLSRILWGARTVLAVAPVAVLGATILGSLLGLAAGYHRRWIDLVISRACDIVLTFPVIILYMIILAHFGSSALNIIGVLGFLGIGLPPPDPDWGGMVKDTYGMMSVWPHMALVPCAAISSLVIGFNLLAIGLREIGLRD